MTISGATYGEDLKLAREKHRRQKCLDAAVRYVVPNKYVRTLIVWNPLLYLPEPLAEEIRQAFKRLMEERGV